MNYINDLSTATGTEAFSIQYDGYEVTSSYSGMEDFFTVEATPGKVLLVTKFAVTNISDQSENLNLYSAQTKFKLKLNEESYKAQQTLLLNDLSMYKEDLEAGATAQTVLVFEIPEASASNTGNMELKITVEDKESTMLLQGGSAVVNVKEEQSEEVTDLAAEYEAALQAEEANQEEVDSESGTMEEEKSGGNVTVVGSNHSISYQ